MHAPQKCGILHRSTNMFYLKYLNIVIEQYFFSFFVFVKQAGLGNETKKIKGTDS